MTGILSAQELRKKIAIAEGEKASAAAKKLAAVEAEKKALLERMSRPSGLTDDQILEKASIIINHAVENGLTMVQVYRFPHQLCTDNGRAINQAEDGWEKTLTGTPKEIYDFWQRQLRPRGYHIRYEIIDYPGGMPGDVGIILSWAKTAVPASMAARRRFALVLPVVLATCAAPEQWKKDGADDATLAKDTTDCRTTAREEALRRYPYGFSSPSFGATGMVAAQQRDDTNRSIVETAAFNACMQGKGYARTPSP
jgi:hypothetical protein